MVRRSVVALFISLFAFSVAGAGADRPDVPKEGRPAAGPAAGLGGADLQGPPPGGPTLAPPGPAIGPGTGRDRPSRAELLQAEAASARAIRIPADLVKGPHLGRPPVFEAPRPGPTERRRSPYAPAGGDEDPIPAPGQLLGTTHLASGAYGIKRYEMLQKPPRAPGGSGAFVNYGQFFWSTTSTTCGRNVWVEIGWILHSGGQPPPFLYAYRAGSLCGGNPGDDFWIDDPNGGPASSGWSYSPSGPFTRLTVPTGNNYHGFALVYDGTIQDVGKTWHKVKPQFDDGSGQGLRDLWYILPNVNNVPFSFVGEAINWIPVEDTDGAGRFFSPTTWEGYSQSEIRGGDINDPAWETGDDWETFWVQQSQGGTWVLSPGATGDAQAQNGRFFKRAYGDSYFLAVFTDTDSCSTWGSCYNVNSEKYFDGYRIQYTSAKNWVSTWGVSFLQYDPVITGDNATFQHYRLCNAPTTNDCWNPSLRRMAEIGWVKGTVNGVFYDKKIYTRIDEIYTVHPEFSFVPGTNHAFQIYQYNDGTFKHSVFYFYNGSTWELVRDAITGWLGGYATVAADLYGGPGGNINRDDYPQVTHGSVAGPDIQLLDDTYWAWQTWTTSIPTAYAGRWSDADQPNPLATWPANWRWMWNSPNRSYWAWNDPWR